MKNSKQFFSISAVALAVLSGCSSDSDYNFKASEARQQKAAELTVAPYDPTNGVFPMPNDLLFTGTQDLTINIPVADDTDYGNPRVALNTLDGFSTIEPIVANFNSTFAGDFSASGAEIPLQLIDASTVALEDTVRVFEVTRGMQFEVTGIVEELDASKLNALIVPADPATSANGSTLVIQPKQPLKEGTTYMVLVTNGVKDETGAGLAKGITFSALTGPDNLEGASGALQGAIRAMLAAGASEGVSADSVVMAWTFSTQTITPILNTLKGAAISSPIALVDTNQDTGDVVPGSPSFADIFAGTLSVPYYLDVPSETNPTAPLRSFFTNASDSFLTPLDNSPVSKNTLNIPVLMTKPKTEMPAEGYPIAIFQHGITRSRSDVLLIADAMAQAGFATIAIDMPMHGITPDDDFAPLRQAGSERTFDVDYVNNETGAPGPDGNVDTSGSHFYNLANLLNTRDNTRQAVADLFTLSASLSTIADIDSSRKAYIGHSLGAIVGTTFLAFDDTISTASLAFGGGGLPRILANSPAFGPRIAAGLLAGDVVLDSAEGNAFLNAAQTVVDSVDPINHAAAAGSNATVHMLQINKDQVVINNLAQYPLVGTEPLAAIMGLSQVTSTTAGSGFVKFSTGYHGSLLDPRDADLDDEIDAGQALAVFQELQAQVATFAASAGSIVLSNPAVIDGAATP